MIVMDNGYIFIWIERNDQIYQLIEENNKIKELKRSKAFILNVWLKQLKTSSMN